MISSTDAASVFSILRSKKLGLKENTTSLLEMESGSNDPCSYMLTAIVLSVMNGKADGGQIALLMVSQLVFGVLFGAGIAVAARLFLSRFRFGSSGVDMTFFIGLALLSYALPSLVGGNGYLSAYIVGIVLGNSKVKNKAPVVNFFDGLTSLMQILIFFLLGLLATPSEIPAVLPAAAAITVFMTFAARPLAVSASVPGALFHPAAGAGVLRGPAGGGLHRVRHHGDGARGRHPHDVYHLVFCIVLLSIAFQGSLLPRVSAKLSMIDHTADVSKTFNDYQEESDIDFIKIHLDKNHPWNGKTLGSCPSPPICWWP